MRLSLLLTAVTILNTYANVFSQNSKINISAENIPIKELLKEVEAKSGYAFFFNDNHIELNKRISFETSEMEVQDLLEKVLQNTQLGYKIIEDKLIVIVKNTNSQEITIKGTVTDSEGNPLPGVNIVEKGTTSGGVTDLDGNYTISVSSKDAILVFSYVGFLTEEIAVSGQTTINIAMVEDIQSLDEVVVIGYGAVKKSDLTGSVSSISKDDMSTLPVNDVQQIIQGRASGVQVIQNSHSPGGGISMRIRGANSVLGGSDPLYVVDGFIGGIGLNSINPNDIESIEILKDASATAIYGARGANGVVIITTKRGQEGVNQINFDSYYGVQEVAKKIDVMNAREFAEIANARVVNDGGSVLPFPDLDNLPYDTDWQDEIFRTAPIQSHSLSISGGDKSTQYLISGNYFKQEGVVINTDFERATLRANLDRKIGKLKISNSFQASRVTKNNISEGGDKGQIQSALSAYPTRPVMENGEYTQMDITEYGAFSDPINNPVAEILERTSEIKSTRLFDLVYGEFEILEGLKAKVSLGANYANSRGDYYSTRRIPNISTNGSATITDSESFNFLNENTLNYNKIFNENSLNALIGFTSQRDEYKYFDAGSTDFVTDVLKTGNLSSGETVKIPSSSGTIWSQQSVLGRVNYVHKGKYLATITGRYDGSSRVAEDNRWTFFPSFALGWRVSEEDFLNNREAISNFKLRFSWGKTGNDRIPSYLSQQKITAVTLSSGEEIVVGMAPANLPSSDLKWEVTAQTDIGFDIGFFNERLRFTADYYSKLTTDLLAQIQLPLSVGYGNVIQNIGELKNTGFEASIGTNIFVNEFKWSVDANISTNKNEVTKLKDGSDVFATSLPGGASSGAFHIVREGEALASYYGFVYEGLDENGDLVYKDFDGDGSITNEEDRTILGDFFPDLTYGFSSNFSYKGVELSVFFQGVYGVDLVRLDRFRLANSLTRGYNQLAEVTDYWTPDNLDASYPKPRSGINFQGSDQLLEDASYLRLKNVTLGYNLPVDKWGINWIRSLKIYANGQNLLTFTDYEGFDPEINNYGNNTVSGNTDLRLGVDVSSYPSSRTFTFGFNLGF